MGQNYDHSTRFYKLDTSTFTKMITSMHCISLLLFLYLKLTNSLISHNKHYSTLKSASITSLKMMPTERVFQASQIELLRILGRVDIVTETNNNPSLTGSISNDLDISIRIFEARLLDGTKCYLKEYSSSMPNSIIFGKKEQSITRKLTLKWLNYQQLTEENKDKIPFFTPLLGYLITDLRIESSEFLTKWRSRFPSSKPPEAGKLLIVLFIHVYINNTMLYTLYIFSTLYICSLYIHTYYSNTNIIHHTYLLAHTSIHTHIDTRILY